MTPRTGLGHSFAAAACLVVLAACGGEAHSETKAIAVQADARTTAFLDRHWHRPLQANGPPPASFGPVEASLDPSACGQCHPRQYADWQTTLHSRAMGPGLLGQLQAMGTGAQEGHQACLRCHAPLAEQAVHLARTLAEDRPLPAETGGASSVHGLGCAGCHVRGHMRFGPPRRDGTVPAPGTSLPHGGWQATVAFSDSRFCAACHQFEADGFSLNGKPLENTHAEWVASRHAREGRTCQSCHMPGRRHLWRGIHDPEMVRSGLSIDVALDAVAGGMVRAELRIANTGVGHAFPTYVTPQVLVEIGQEDRQGKLIPSSIDRHRIARDVSLDLTTESSDTRLMPDEQRRYRYQRPREPRAVAVQYRILVQPDAFYVGFYRAVLRDPDYGREHATLREALLQAEYSPYELFRTRHPLPAPATR